MSTERTFIAIKPDGVQRGLIGKIIKRFEQRGFKLVAMKLCKPGKEHLETHYADLKSKVNSRRFFSTEIIFSTESYPAVHVPHAIF